MDDEAKTRLEALEDAVRALTERVAVLEDSVGIMEDMAAWSGLRPVSPKMKVEPRKVPDEALLGNRPRSAAVEAKLKEIIDRFDINNYLKKKPDK
jgi:hypothetical protein